MAAIYIPQKIEVGFQQRSDTFTGQLAYVVYRDQKNVLRKEKSWNSWRNKDIEPKTFDNEPMTGFIFNKGIKRSSEWFGSGRTVFRVYAPHDFEFEINADNLLNLLMHSDVSRREILEPCVFAWAGTELILLPTNSVEYQEAVEHTAKQARKVSTKELIKGAQYQQKNSTTLLTYIGHLPWWEFGYMEGTKFKNQRWYSNTRPRIHINRGKKHVFWDGKTFDTWSVSTLSNVVSEDIVDNYAELVDNFYSTWHSQPVTNIIISSDDIPVNDEINNWGYYYNWPILCKVENGYLNWIYVQGHYRTNQDGYDFRYNASFTEYRHQFTPSPDPNVSIQTTRLGGNRLTSSYSYRWGQNTSFSETPDASRLHITLMQLAEAEGYDYKNLLPSQYVHLMTKLGYGIPKHVLQNGRTIKYVGDQY